MKKKILSIFTILMLVLITGCIPKTGEEETKKNIDDGGTVVTAGVPSGSVRIHYHRYNGDYNGWGLHLWGAADTDKIKPNGNDLEWTNALEFDQTDDYGVYVDIPVSDFSADFNYVVHNGETKDVASDRLLDSAKLVDQAELYLIEGNIMAGTVAYYTGVQVKGIEINSTSKMTVNLTSNMAVPNSDFHLLDNLGTEVMAYTYTQNEAVVTITGLNLDLSKNYKATIKTAAYTWASFSKELANTDDFYYTGNDLGATLNSDGTAILKLWTPVATKVMVHVYDKADQTKEVTTVAGISLTRGAKGVWSLSLNETNAGIADLDGYFYQYEITANGQTKRALDPYAKSMAAYDPAGDDKVGKAAIINTQSLKAKPDGFDSNTINKKIMANNVDMIVSEIHVRDFTIGSEDVEKELRGTYRGFVGGANYLKELGITHVQLLPVQNFYTVDESDRSFVGENAEKINFNWGYDPHNYFTPEGWYSSDASDPYARLKELKELVQSLHEAGIGVIMDVVYNHTYNNDVFNNVAPGLYYRPAGGSCPVGAPAVATENKMVRKMIIDSMKYYVDEFGIDGFRFDLMGFMDKQTMDDIRTALGNDIVLHGEAWNFTDLPDGASYVKAETDNNINIGYFNDTSRDSYTAHVDSAGSKGFLLGQFSQNAKAKAGIIAGIKGFPQDSDKEGMLYTNIDTDNYNVFADSPEDTLNYQSVHDGFTLWDRINLAFDGTVEERIARHNQTLAMLMTSQGKIINQGGIEIARTKPLADNDKESDRAHTTDYVNPEKGTVYFHENSYSSSDFTNMIDWDRGNEFTDVLGYYKGLIKMRRNIPAFRYSTGENIKNGLRFIGETKPENSGELVEFAGYTAFSEIGSFTINFINAADSVKGKTYYFAGEATPEAVGGVNDGNSAEMEMHSVKIEENGKGSITFSKDNIDKFVLGAWGATEDLNFKLVENPGGWDAPEGAYSGSGNTRIIPGKILKDNTITVDLSIVDYMPGSGSASIAPNKFIAYTLDNTLENDIAPGLGGTSFEKLIVVHNAAESSITINTDEIVNKDNWVVIMDGNEAGIEEVSSTNVEIKDGEIIVPANSSAVIAK